MQLKCMNKEEGKVDFLPVQGKKLFPESIEK